MTTATDRVQLLDEYADDIGAMATWIAARTGRDTDDVRQDLAVIVLRDGHKFDPDAVGIRRWLWVRFIALRIRPLARQPVTVPMPVGPIDGEPFDVPGGEPDPAEVAERGEAIAAVRLAVGRLPDGERALIADVYGFGDRPEVSQSRLAADLGVDPATLRATVARVRGRLGERLGGWS